LGLWRGVKYFKIRLALVNAEVIIVLTLNMKCKAESVVNYTLLNLLFGLQQATWHISDKLIGQSLTYFVI